MTAQELINILSCVPPDTQIVLREPNERTQISHTTNVAVNNGYFVKDDSEDKIGFFVHDRYASVIQEDGKPLLDLTSANIQSALLLDRIFI
jgi:hypothetical protein